LIETPAEIGSEEVVNGDFSNGSTGWVLASGWSVSGGKAVSNGVSSSSYLYQENILTLGATYKITVDVTRNSGEVRVYITSSVTQTINSSGTFTFYATCDRPDLTLYFQSIYFNGSIDNVSVKEYNDKNLARIDYLDDANGVLLTEPQSTNLLPYSEDFSVWVSTNLVITQNTITSPNGNNTADKIAASDVTNQHRVNFTSTNISGATTFSFFAKSAEYTSCWARVGFSNAYFDLENGLTSSGTGVTSSIENYGNGWYRCIMTKASSTANEVCRINITTSYLSTGNFLGDNISGIYLWGAQHEQGSYPTSYIPTYGSISTRNKDTVNNAGTSATYNSVQGVLFVEMAALTSTVPLNNWITISDGTADNQVAIGFETNSNITAGFRGGGSYTGYITLNVDYSQNKKIGFKYKENDFALWIDGVEVGVDTSGSTLSSGTLSSLQFNWGAGGNHTNGKTKNVQVFNEALSDSDLLSLTTTGSVPYWRQYSAMATSLNYTNK